MVFLNYSKGELDFFWQLQTFVYALLFATVALVVKLMLKYQIRDQYLGFTSAILIAITMLFLSRGAIQNNITVSASQLIKNSLGTTTNHQHYTERTLHR